MASFPTPGRGANTASCAIRQQLAGETVYTRFHEGMDIRPMRRDGHGEPLDEVRAMADGTVVYASKLALQTTVAMWWSSIAGEAALTTVSTRISTRSRSSAGQRVRQGEKLAIMGHTGTGIDRERAHVHVELNLLLNTHFEGWHAAVFPR